MKNEEPEKIILAAMTEDRVIGCGSGMPWHIPAELRLFRDLTLGHAVVMGRRTFEAIGRPLQQRRNLVLSRTLPSAAGIEVCRSFEEALARTARSGKVFFIGGREVFSRALAIAGTLRISWIPGEYAGDVRFPKFDPAEWEPVEEREFADFRHVVYRRVQIQGQAKRERFQD